MRFFGRMVLAAVLFAPVAAVAQLEHQVKAAFLYRFLSYIEWPAESLDAAPAPLVIAVLGADEVHAELHALVAGRQAQGRPLVVRRLKEGERPARAHLVFVGRRAAAALPGLAGVHGQFLVADWPGALEQGAMVNFVPVDGRIRFEAAPDMAERRGLRISSRMLAVALRVKQVEP